MAFARLLILGGLGFFAAPMAASAKSAPSCTGRILVFNSYENAEDGKVVLKHSIFEPIGWTEHSTFEGFVVRANERADAMTIELRPAKKAKVTTKASSSFTRWDRDISRRIAKDIDPKKILTGRTGLWTVRLTKGTRVLCESSFPVSKAD